MRSSDGRLMWNMGILFRFCLDLILVCYVLFQLSIIFWKLRNFIILNFCCICWTISENFHFSGAEPLIEYFVPRSISEFDLSITTDEASAAGNFLPLTVRVPRRVISKQKEKMVTFEDELEIRADNPNFNDVFMWQKG